MCIFASRSNCADKIMWIMDDIFRFTHFGIVSWIHDDFFIQEGKERKALTLEKLKHHLQLCFVTKKRQYLILFPEGGFLRKRKLSSQNFAQKNDLPVLENCTLPRMGAVNSVIQALNIDPRTDRNKLFQENPAQKSCFRLNKVVDVTIAYPDGKPLSLVDISFGMKSVSKIHVHYKVYDIYQVPTDSEKLRRWIYNVYYEKEKLLDSFYETGTFSKSKVLTKDSDKLLELQFDPLRFIFINSFFLVSTYIFCQLWYKLYSYFCNIINI